MIIDVKKHDSNQDYILRIYNIGDILSSKLINNDLLIRITFLLLTDRFSHVLCSDQLTHITK